MAKLVSSHYGQIASKVNTNPKPEKKKKRKNEEPKPKVTQKKDTQKSKPSVPSTEASSQYKSYKKSSFAPKTVKPKKKTTSLQSAQKAFQKGQQVRATQAKYKVSNTSAPKTSGNIADSFKVSKSDLNKAFKTGSKTTYLGGQQKTKTETATERIQAVKDRLLQEPRLENHKERSQNQEQ